MAKGKKPPKPKLQEQPQKIKAEEDILQDAPVENLTAKESAKYLVYSALLAIVFTGVLAIVFTGVLFLYLHCPKAKLANRGLLTKTTVRPAMSSPPPDGYTSYYFYIDGKQFGGAYKTILHPPHGGDSISVLYLPENPTVNAIPEDTKSALASFMRYFCK
jgi:hypothetical protein